MSKYSELVYMITDLLKLFSDDSVYTEDHIIYLLDTTRAYLLEQKYGNDSRKEMSRDNLQTIEITFEESEPIENLDQCFNQDFQYKSKCKIPSLMRRNWLSVKLKNFNYVLQYVSPERFEYVGFDRYGIKMAYCTIGYDGYVYIKTPIVINEEGEKEHLKLTETKLLITALFGSPREVVNFRCGEKQCKPEEQCPADECSILNKDFPIENELIQQLIEIITTKLAAAIYKPADPQNNSTDDMASIQAFIRQAMKDKFVKETQS